jgi:hypothetical protein
LIAESTAHEQTTAGGQEIVPSPSTRVWAVDWNRDGWLDLLVGDGATITNPKEGVTQEEYELRKKDFTEKMQELQTKRQPLYERYQAATKDGQKPDEELMKEMQASSQEVSQLFQSRSEFQDEQRTGFVWLYVRKPNAP